MQQLCLWQGKWGKEADRNKLLDEIKKYLAKKQRNTDSERTLKQLTILRGQLNLNQSGKTERALLRLNENLYQAK